MAAGRKNTDSETDKEVEKHLKSARRSVQAAMDVVRSGQEKGFRSRRAQRDLQELEMRMRQVSSVTNPYDSDVDLMPEERLTDIRRRERMERHEKRRAATEVMDG